MVPRVSNEFIILIPTKINEELIFPAGECVPPNIHNGNIFHPRRWSACYQPRPLPSSSSNIPLFKIYPGPAGARRQKIELVLGWNLKTPRRGAVGRAARGGRAARTRRRGRPSTKEATSVSPRRKSLPCRWTRANASATISQVPGFFSQNVFAF